MINLQSFLTFLKRNVGVAPFTYLRAARNKPLGAELSQAVGQMTGTALGMHLTVATWRHVAVASGSADP